MKCSSVIDAEIVTAKGMVPIMKARFFTADSREAAEALAEAYFGCGKGEITFEEAVREKHGSAGPQSQLLAFFGAPGDLANIDAIFGIYYEKDGVYLELIKERGSGRPFDNTVLATHLNRKNINRLDGAAVQALVSAQNGRVRIAPPQQEFIYGEDIIVEIAGNASEARAILLAPEQGGEPMQFEAAKQKIESAGIKFGLDEQALRELIEAKEYGEKRVVAVAKQAVNGEDGKLIFHFSTDERTGRPREIGGGRVDYRSLDLFVPVVEDQLLVTRVLATEGTAGMTVRGQPLTHKPGKEVNLPKSKNVNINDDRTEMRAMYSGMVEYLHSSINVSSVYKINGDCDLSVGNIDFDGSVHISGSIRSGHTVKATGAIVVGGGVEAATVIAGGNIDIKSGMQGADKGRIEAGGSVTIMFVERGTIIAEGQITVDVSIHSILEAGGSLNAKGKRGAIIGGRACAAGDVTASSLGSLSHAKTEIEVGMMPRKRIRIQTLEKEIERLKNEMIKLDQLDAYLEKSKEKMDPKTWDKLSRSGAENRRGNKQILEEDDIEIGELKHELEHATESRVHVLDTVFQGTKIIIGNGMYNVREEIKFSTFKYKDGEIDYGTCEASKSKA